ncbi:unnamed protein product [Bursaphelenchus okinawaensis]|uniref:Uncharacterized protein n=1 Tax=Bursaphelenchus okinawaensis TaxID=465554 RepID=A0A811LM77_9BILA|nr:unnamed protein product [Bursaphelenchus okinawaensis]CAG9125043.1 unnamed protein product [Bursaphelenchus okinawaensis]
MRIAPLPRQLTSDSCAQASSSDYSIADFSADAPPAPFLYNTAELNAPCNDWTSLSVICFGVCELTIRRLRSAAPSRSCGTVVD